MRSILARTNPKTYWTGDKFRK